MLVHQLNAYPDNVRIHIQPHLKDQIKDHWRLYRHISVRKAQFKNKIIKKPQWQTERERERERRWEGGDLSKRTNLTRHKAAKFQVKYSKSTEMRTSVQVRHQTAIDFQTSVQVQHQEQYTLRHLCKCNIKSNTDSDICASAASTAIRIQISVQVQHQRTNVKPTTPL